MAERFNGVKTSFFGKGSVRLLGPELQRMGVRRVLVVTDRFLYESGAAAQLGQVLSQAGAGYAVFYQVQPNPTVQVVEDCAAAIQSLSAEMLVALGGGSAIDTAKAASILAANGGPLEQYEGENKSRVPGVPIAAVNTTAGTGSECTAFYIVTDPVRRSKMAMVDVNCMVSIAINDTDFMTSMPPALTAATGMDALTHAIEAVLSRGASPLTDKDALWAVEQIFQYLPQAAADGSDEAARTGMAYAEYAAGMAFSNAGLGMVHAMAHALGGRYNLPHGVCNAVLLPYVLAFHLRCPVCCKRLERIARAAGLPEESPQAVISAVRRLNRQLGIPACLSELNGVAPADFPGLAALALHDTCMASDQLEPTAAEVTAVYLAAFNEPKSADGAGGIYPAQ